MKLFNFLFNLKKKTVEPKLYVFVLSGKGFTQLMLNTNYDYETALEQSRRQYLDFLRTKGITADGYEVKVEIWVSATIMDIFGNYMETDIKEIPKEEQDKNKLMASIIKKKDVSLIEKHADKLTENDKKYILEMINGKK